MTLNEFKAWLEGYSDSWGPRGTPTAEQWRKIRDKLNTVTVLNTPRTISVGPWKPSGQLSNDNNLPNKLNIT